MLKDLDISQWKEEMDSMNSNEFEIIDVRTPEEQAAGVIPGAKLVDYFDSEALLSFINTLDQDKTYFVYCKAGARSMHVCQIMQQMGFLKTNNLYGGIMAWANAGHPIK